MKRKIYFLNSHSEYSGKSGMKASKLAVKSKYADDEYVAEFSENSGYSDSGRTQYLHDYEQ